DLGRREGARRRAFAYRQVATVDQERRRASSGRHTARRGCRCVRGTRRRKSVRAAGAAAQAELPPSVRRGSDLAGEDAGSLSLSRETTVNDTGDRTGPVLPVER